MLLRRDLPQLLDADAVLLRLDAVAQVEFLHELLRQRAAAAFGEQRVLRVQLHPLLVVGLVRAVARDAHVARRHAADRAALVVEDFGGRKTRVDLHAQRLGLLREPPAHVAEARDVVAVVVHQRRQQPPRHAVGAVGRQDEEAVLGDRRGDRRALRLPVGQELADALGVDDGAGQDVRADLGALFEHAHRHFALLLRGELLQPDRRGQSGRTPADDHDVVFHGFAGHSGTLWLPAAARPVKRTIIIAGASPSGRSCAGSPRRGDRRRTKPAATQVRPRRLCIPASAIRPSRLHDRTTPPRPHFRAAHPVGRHGRARPRQQHRVLPVHGAGAHRVAVRAREGARRLRDGAGAGDRERELQFPGAARLSGRRRGDDAPGPSGADERRQLLRHPHGRPQVRGRRREDRLDRSRDRPAGAAAGRDRRAVARAAG